MVTIDSVDDLKKPKTPCFGHVPIFVVLYRVVTAKILGPDSRCHAERPLHRFWHRQQRQTGQHKQRGNQVSADGPLLQHEPLLRQLRRCAQRTSVPELTGAQFKRMLG